MNLIVENKKLAEENEKLRKVLTTIKNELEEKRPYVNLEETIKLFYHTCEENDIKLD